MNMDAPNQEAPMGRDVRVSEIREAIATIRCWSDGSAYLPEANADLLKAMADLLEALLVHGAARGKPAVGSGGQDDRST